MASSDLHLPSVQGAAQSAGGVIYDPGRRRVLLIKSARDGSWTLPKGRRDPGELLHETARREGREETGVTAKVERKLLVHRTKRAQRHFYLMRKKKQRKKKPCRETAKVKWFAPAEALTRPARARDRRVVRAALRWLGWD
jgi:8-oxo-dGTP pyrophosphatase MutT (NUDIX family)